MALGEWLSVESSRELYANQLAIKAEQLDSFPELVEEELRVLYEAKGIGADDGRLAKRVVSGNRAAAITVMTGRHPLLAGLRQLAFGLVAAAITFAIGALLGTTVG
jgi:VIT1/CCC1 family predicted Fe2+/Mn2+ transporter